jgi:hypothetical protein
MPKEFIDEKNLTITGVHKKMEEVAVDFRCDDDVIIQVTDAYGPKGDSIIGFDGVDFDGQPGIAVAVRALGIEGIVHLSPFHGDRRKKGDLEIPVGTVCELFCPVSGAPLDRIGPVNDGSGADYFAIYLTTKLCDGETVMISNIWGHYHSRIVDDFELISYWATHDEELHLV